jgi:HD-GYP domain-containing protein (c-di-GMP phosphodiesterase class II)/DNA-binding CsgD family transcriptional regulator
MPAAVQEALRFVFEQWDGSGPRGRRGEAIPMLARIVHATLFLEVLHQMGGRPAAVKLARGRRGTGIDPAVADSFERLAQTESFWRGLEDESVWAVVCQMEPDSPYRYLSEARLDDAATAFADFADLKSFYSAGHSRRVAALVERMASIVGLAQADLATLRRAALLHDVGLVALPAFVLHKPENRLTAAERETLRLHPYHAERILARVPAFTPVVPLVGAHHEQPDGGGYFRGIGHPKIPLGARVIAVADRFDELTHARPGRPALDAHSALGEMRRDVPAALCADAFAALGRALAVPTVAAPRLSAASVPDPHIQPRTEWPAGLTDREVEVVRLLATGASRRAMAHSLSVSEHTIRHHLEHIYDKIDVHTRVEVTLFAIEHGLLR